MNPEDATTSETARKREIIEKEWYQLLLHWVKTCGQQTTSLSQIDFMEIVRVYGEGALYLQSQPLPESLDQFLHQQFPTLKLQPENWCTDRDPYITATVVLYHCVTDGCLNSIINICLFLSLEQQIFIQKFCENIKNKEVTITNVNAAIVAAYEGRSEMLEQRQVINNPLVFRHANAKCHVTKGIPSSQSTINIFKKSSSKVHKAGGTKLYLRKTGSTFIYKINGSKIKYIGKFVNETGCNVEASTSVPFKYLTPKKQSVNPLINPPVNPQEQDIDTLYSNLPFRFKSSEVMGMLQQDKASSATIKTLPESRSVLSHTRITMLSNNLLSLKQMGIKIKDIQGGYKPRKSMHLKPKQPNTFKNEDNKIKERTSKSFKPPNTQADKKIEALDTIYMKSQFTVQSSIYGYPNTPEMEKNPTEKAGIAEKSLKVSDIPGSVKKVNLEPKKLKGNDLNTVSDINLIDGVEVNDVNKEGSGDQSTPEPNPVDNVDNTLCLKTLKPPFVANGSPCRYPVEANFQPENIIKMSLIINTSTHVNKTPADLNNTEANNVKEASETSSITEKSLSCRPEEIQKNEKLSNLYKENVQPVSFEATVPKGQCTTPMRVTFKNTPIGRCTCKCEKSRQENMRLDSPPKCESDFYKPHFITKEPNKTSETIECRQTLYENDGGKCDDGLKLSEKLVGTDFILKGVNVRCKGGTGDSGYCFNSAYPPVSGERSSSASKEQALWPKQSANQDKSSQLRRQIDRFTGFWNNPSWKKPSWKKPSFKKPSWKKPSWHTLSNKKHLRKILLAAILLLLPIILLWLVLSNNGAKEETLPKKPAVIAKKLSGQKDEDTRRAAEKTSILLLMNKNPSNVYFSWECKNGLCRKVDKPGKSSFKSLSRCTLLCTGPQMWPYPMGAKMYSDRLIALAKNNVTHNHQSVPSPIVRKYLDVAFDLFKKDLARLESTNLTTTEDLDLNAMPLSIVTNVQIDPNPRLRLETDESFTLTVRTTDKIEVVIISNAFAGVRHGLETLSQLILLDQRTGFLITLMQATIKDAPRYKYRGLMIDTARNFIPLTDLIRTVDAMAMCKMNTFHWRISDATSFPMKIPKFPELFKYGGYDDNMVYTKDNIETLVYRARIRGIRVVIEVAAPGPVGRAWSWSSNDDSPLAKEKRMLTTTRIGNDLCLRLGMQEPVFDVLQAIYSFIIELTKVDDVFHLSNSLFSIVKCLGLIEDREEFLERALDRLKIANKGTLPKLPLIWYNADLMRKTGKLWDTYGIQIHADKLPKKGIDKYKLIQSSRWDLSCEINKQRCTKYRSWQQMYKWNCWQDLPVMNIVGGEAVLWTDLVDTNNLDTHLWPRTAAVAERLWSGAAVNGSPSPNEYLRFDAQRWRMLIRGVRTQPVWPVWCNFDPEPCFAKIKTETIPTIL